MNARPLHLLLCGALTACSSFDAKWRAAEKDATRWEGRWTSEKHLAPGGGPAGGRLRGVLQPAPEKSLRADFHANWLLFASDYTMTLVPVKNSPTDFHGTHELPKMFGGTYRYSAKIDGDRFTARYDSSYDHGTFTLHRLRVAKDCFPNQSRH